MPRRRAYLSPRSGRLIKRGARAYDHHPPRGGKKINKIPLSSPRPTAFIGHPISTTYFATSPTTLGRPTCSFHPHQPPTSATAGRKREREACVPVSGFAGAPLGGGGARGREIEGERRRTRALLSRSREKQPWCAPSPRSPAARFAPSSEPWLSSACQLVPWRRDGTVVVPGITLLFSFSSPFPPLSSLVRETCARSGYR